ncbi:hypothetical protein BU24DRAFT_361071 [Aaosphaeria arxii CBS 175.79]|uniref:DUF3074 domain-containing protein n=1 Tax=Aaosphaeria arxii CBS 175.79 TaxID=1450172 RepID=A0A6A5Y748_9PLEO|nr:uncharacterized protein BU24DRAFT_361071 [Aaosphaeria arxii CBS 175.79]KAF2020571.1 hypothetical protein BU24DRAFT_361071 [Aaosphaeria arxii CBS 175.79]
MSQQLHQALESLRPKDYSDVPLDELQTFLADLFCKGELIANSVPEPPNGTPFDKAQRSRPGAHPATVLQEIAVSKVRRPPPSKEQAELQKAWGKPVKLSAKDNPLEISVYKMAGNDRHGAWFARTSVHEGLGFAKWKRAMIREFPESLEVQGGPGEGNIRGIGGDRRLEDINVEGVGKLEVYQLSAQFPGPVAPREFITLLLTSENALSEASKVAGIVPRHFMVVSIPVTHPEAPPRQGLVRGFYESIEMIREIPLCKSAASESNDINRQDSVAGDDPETNPVEWIMVTRSDPGGGIPRFMVERNTPSSIVQDAGKFLTWAVTTEDVPMHGELDGAADVTLHHADHRQFSISDGNGILAGVGTSIADNSLTPGLGRRSSHIANDGQPGIMNAVTDAVGAYIPDSLNPLQRTDSRSSSASSISSVDSWVSAEQFGDAHEGVRLDDGMPTPSSVSEKSGAVSDPQQNHVQMSRELEKIEQKRMQLREKLEQARERQGIEASEANAKSAKEMEKAIEKHNRERKKQEEKFNREVEKLEQRRERETKKLLARQQKEADKNRLNKLQRERNEWKERADLAEQENKLLKEQIGELQRENTKLVARLGKSDVGREILKKVKDDSDSIHSHHSLHRHRASSGASIESPSTASRTSLLKNSEPTP